jgi:D-beta-D-heptose 7-phosphate kinase/D-beta-D-heptose 1-phosphate adenosyltransferase
MTILILGDLIVDEYWQGQTNRLSPEAPVPVITDIEKHQRAGGAANVALNIHSMGTYTLFISQSALDFNRSLLKNLKQLMLYSSITPTKVRITANGHIVCRIDREQYQSAELSPDWLTHDVKICVLSDYNKGFLHNSKEFIAWCNQKNIKTIVDPKKDWAFYQGCWLLKANAKELADQLGRSYQMDELETVCEELSKKFEIQNLVITLGHNGLYVWTGQHSKLIPAVKNNVIDVTGAGDVVIAALAHYAYQNHNLISAAEKANRLAAVSVSKQGTYIVTPEDLKNVEKKLVFTNGCFDILHKGHISYLKQSRALGTRLIVGLNSDASIKRIKGPDRPINNQNDRKAMLESLEFVDEVIVFDQDTPRELIEKIQPDIITKGGDYTVDQVVGNDLVNQVVIIPTTQGYSTSNIIKLIGDKS